MSLYDVLRKIKQDSDERKLKEQTALTSGTQAGVNAMAGFTGMPAPEIKTPGYEIVTKPDPKPMEWNTLNEIGGTVARIPGQAASQILGMGAFVTGSEKLAEASTLAGEQARRDFPSAAPQISSMDDLSKMSLTDLAKYGLSETGQVGASVLSMAIPGMGASKVLSGLGAASKLVPAISKIAGYSPKIAKLVTSLGGTEAAAAHAARGLSGWFGGTMLEAGSITTDAYSETGEMPERLKVLPWAMAAGAMEYIPLDRLLSRFASKAGMEVAEQAAGKSAKDVIQFIIDYAKSFGAEAGTEFLQTLTEESAVENIKGTPAMQAVVKTVTDPNAIARGIGAGLSGGFGGVGMTGITDLGGAVAKARKQVQAEPEVRKPVEPVTPTPVQQQPQPEPIPMPTQPTQPTEPEPEQPQAATTPPPSETVSAPDVGGSSSVSEVKLKKMAKNVKDAMEAIGVTDDMVQQMTGKPLADMDMTELQQVNEFVMNQAAQGNVVETQPPAQTPAPMPPVAPPASLQDAMARVQRQPEMAQPGMPAMPPMAQPGNLQEAMAMAKQPRQPMPQTQEVTRQITPEDIAPFADQPEQEQDTGLPERGEIYEVTVNTKDGPVKKFALRGDSKDGFGDNLFNSREEAEYWKNKEKEVAEANEKFRKEGLERDRIEQEKIEKKKAELADKRAKSPIVIDAGYVNSLGNMDRGRLNKILDAEISYAGKTMTRRELIESGTYSRKESRERNGKQEYYVVTPNDRYLKIPKVVYDAVTYNEAVLDEAVRRDDEGIPPLSPEDEAALFGKAKEPEPERVPDSIVRSQKTQAKIDEREAELDKIEADMEKRPVYGESNTVVTTARYEELKKKFKAKTKNITSGIDPELAAISVEMAAYHLEAGVRKFADFVKAVISDVGEEFRPYLASAYMGAKYFPGSEKYRSEMDSEAEIERFLAAEPTAAEPTTADIASKLLPFAESLLTRDKPATNPMLDAAMREAGLDPDNRKQAQESLEGAITLLIRKNNLYGDFYQLKKLYENMPNLNERTGGSMTRQAYSTPHILASLLTDSLGLSKSKRLTVYEPTAGNGLLLSGISENQEGTRHAYFLNELDNNRNNMLKALFPDADITNQDATEFSPDINVDLVMANPPFGSIETKRVQTIKGEKSEIDLKKLEYYIAWKALENMRDDGKAVIILGAEKENQITGNHVVFTRAMYNQYNVTGHFELDGQFYRKMGAEWPVEIFIIEGRKDYPLNRNLVGVPKSVRRIAYAEGWEGVREYINRTDRLVGEPGTGDNAPETERDTQVSDGERGTERQENRPIEGAEVVSAEPAKQEGQQPMADSQRDNEPGRDTERIKRVREQLADKGARQPGQPRDTTTPDAVEPGPDDIRVASDGAKVDALALESDEIGASDSIQEPYNSVSNADSIGALVSKALAVPTREALESLLEKTGEKSLDDYVAKQLGYKSAKDIPFFSAEQIDGLAESFYNLSNGGGNIIADQTGVGKGRMAAAIIQWASRQGKIPVFFTEKVGLFNDIFRDLKAIGGDKLRPFIFNANGEMSYEDDSGKKVVVYKHNKKVFQEVFRRMIAGDYSDFTGPNRKFDYIALTYSQIRDGEEQRGKRGYLKKDAFAMARNLIPILDESHNAAGSAGDVAGSGGGRGGQDKRSNQMANTMEIINRDRADGVTYLSATWAKTPENMPVYYRVFNQANLTQDEIQTAFDRGDIAMQEMVVATLAAAGKYIRREQSFAGVSWKKNETDPKSEQADKEKSQADRAMGATRKLIALDRHITEIFSGLNLTEIIDTFGLDVPEEYIGGDAAASGHIASSLDNPDSPFSSVHNYVNTFLAAVKADRAAERAIEMIKAGKKPIITVQNTMESQMDAIIDSGSAKMGEPFPGTYAEILETKINALMRVTIKHPTRENDSYSFNLPIESLPVETQQRIEAFRAELKKINLKDLPFSPIDYVMAKIKDAGFNVGEITGRGKYLDYSETVNGLPVIKSRPGKDITNAGKRMTLTKFNNGELDALILNSAGATGLSAHSSRDFKDQRQRAMLILQPFDDINTFTQMLGRIHRTGGIYDAAKVTSVIPGKPASYGFPEYEYIQSSLGMETRPAARLDAKAKSLNANTSSNKKGHQDISDIDVSNKYGTRVVRQWLAQNKLYADELGYETDNQIRSAEASQVTGRIAILDQQIQQTFWDEVVKNYNDLIDELDSLDQNDLKVQTYDKADAVTVSKRVVYGEEGNVDNPPVYLEKIDMAVPGNPTSYDAAVNRAKKGKAPSDADIAAADAAFEKFVKYKEDERKEYEERTGKQSGIRIASLEAGAETVKRLINKFKPGVHVSGLLSVETEGNAHSSASVVGIVTSVSLMPSQEGFVGNPWIPSRIRVEIATPSFASGKMILPISRIATWLSTDIQNISPYIEQQQRKEWQKAFDANSNRRVTKTALSGDMIKASSMSTDSRAVQLQRRDGQQELVWLSNREDGDMRVTAPVEKLTDEQMENPPAFMTSMDSGQSVQIADWQPETTYPWQKQPAKKHWRPAPTGENYDIRIRYSSPIRNVILRDQKLAELLDPREQDPFIKETLERNANYMVLKNTIPKKDMQPILKRLSEILNENGSGLTVAGVGREIDADTTTDRRGISGRTGSAGPLDAFTRWAGEGLADVLESAYKFVVRGSGSFLEWLKTVPATARRVATKIWSDARKIADYLRNSLKSRRGGIISPAELIRMYQEAARQATEEGPLPQAAAMEMAESMTEGGIKLGEAKATETAKKVARYRKKQADAKLNIARKKLFDLRQKTSWNYDEKRFLLDYAQKLVTEDKAKMLRDITLATTPRKVDDAIKKITDLIDKRLYKNAMLRFQKTVKMAVKLRPEFQRIARLAPRKVANRALFYETLNAMNNFIEETESAILPPEVQTEIDILLRDRPSKISARALDVVSDALVAVKTVSDSINKQQFGDKAMTLAATVKDVSEHVQTEDKIADEEGNVSGAKWFFNIGSLQFSDITDMLGKVGKDAIYGAIRRGEQITKKLWFQGRDSVHAVMKKHGKDPDDAATRRWYEEKTKLLTNEGEIEVDRRFKMDLIAGLLDPETRKQVLDSTYKKGKRKGQVNPGAGFVVEKKGTKAYRLDKDMFRQMLNGLTAAEQAIINEMRSNLNGVYRSEANKVFVQLTGYEKLIQTGYWPRIRDIDATGLNEGFKNFTPKTALEALGIFKERTGTKSPIVIRDINLVYQNHIKKMSTFIGLAVPARNIEIMLGAGKLGRVLEDRFGKQYVQRIKDQIQAIADLGTPGGGELNKMLSGVLRNVAAGFLGFNPRSMVKQFGGLFTAATEISAGLLFQSIGAATDSKITEEMYKYSPILRDRYDSTGSALVSPTFDQERGLLGTDSKLEMLREKSLSWLQAGDRMVSQVIWAAAKLEIAKKQPDLKGDEFMQAVADRTEQVVSATQNVTSVVDMSGVAIESRKNQAYKLATMFQSQGNSIYNIVRRTIRRFRRGDIELPEMLWSLALASLGNALWSAMIGRLVTLRGWTDRDEGKKASLVGDVAWDVARENVNMIYGGSLLSSTMRNLERISKDEYVFQPGRVENALESVLNSGLKGVENAYRAVKADEEKFKSGPRKGQKKADAFAKEAAWDLARATAPLAGVPVVPFNEFKNLLESRK